MDIKSVLKSEKLTESDTSFIVYDLDKVRSNYEELIDTFPQNTHHALAIKSCPLPRMIRYSQMFGLGAEAASIEELVLAIKSGLTTDKIIFDSPCKTEEEINHAISYGIYINADNYDELERINNIITRRGFKHYKAGLRVNPRIGKGSISDTSVADKDSKFGVILDSKVKEAFDKYDWLVGLHVHSGSQGMSLEELVEGVKVVFEFGESLGIERLDIGGGLPVKYRDEDISYSISEYGMKLKETIPKLFESDIKIITEFGRSIYANTAVAVSRIEYTKGNQITNHLGADMFLRRVYKPDDWFHNITAVDKDGNDLVGPEQTYSIAGPLCFGGDFLSQELKLPKVSEGDLLIINDVGAYTLSMWSRHCSRLTPQVLGVERGNVKTLKHRETFQDLFNFWL